MNRRVAGSALKALLIEMAMEHRRREQETIHVVELKRRNQELERIAAVVSNSGGQPRGSAAGRVPGQPINESAAQHR